MGVKNSDATNHKRKDLPLSRASKATITDKNKYIVII